MTTFLPSWVPTKARLMKLWSLKPLQTRSDPGVELGLAPDLEAIVVLLRLLEVGLDHLPALVDLHREDGKVLALVLELPHGGAEGEVHLADLAREDLREAEEDGQLD